MVTLVLTLAAVSVLSQLIWLAYCVYLIERHPADAERYIKASRRGFPGLARPRAE